MSAIWQYFTSGKSDHTKTGTCEICDKVLKCSGSSTTVLWTHLEKAHQKEFSELKEKISKRKSRVQGPRWKVRTSVQPTLSSVVMRKNPYEVGHPKQAQFDKNVISMIVNNSLPFTIASSKHFKKLVADLDPRIRVRKRQTYSKYIKQMEQPLKNKIRELVKTNSRGYVAVTSDLWDDKKQNSFCSLTAHYVNKEFQLERVTPAIRYFGAARHTSENLADVLTEEIRNIIEKDNDPVVFLVTDSANPMVKMRRMLCERGVVDQEFGCAIHKLQNCIKKAFTETESADKVMKKAKKLSKHIRKSTLADNRLKKACKKTGHKYLRMKSCVEVRWNAQAECLERLLYHRECLDEMDRQGELDNASASVLSRKQWRLLEELMKVLKPLKTATKLLESESEPTINRLAEIVFDEEERLKEFIRSEVSDDVTKHFARNLLADLRQRFPNHGLDCLASCYGNFLDPRLKGIHLEEIGELHDYVEGITRNISTYDVEKEGQDDESDVSDVNENLTPTEKLLRKKNPAQNQEVKSKSVIAAEKEIETYRNLPPCPQDQSVLLWWKSHQDILPRLSILVSYILAIPASSSASERLFSIAGLFDSQRRSRLSVASLETMTLMKTNERALIENNVEIDELSENSDEQESDEGDDMSECESDLNRSTLDQDEELGGGTGVGDTETDLNMDLELGGRPEGSDVESSQSDKMIQDSSDSE